jgi:hypothetical protein
MLSRLIPGVAPKIEQLSPKDAAQGLLGQSQVRERSNLGLAVLHPNHGMSAMSRKSADLSRPLAISGPRERLFPRDSRKSANSSLGAIYLGPRIIALDFAAPIIAIDSPCGSAYCDSVGGEQ